MDDENGESMEPMEKVPLIGLGESERRDWRVVDKHLVNQHDWR